MAFSISMTCNSGQSTPVFLRTSSLTRWRCSSSLKSAVIASYFDSYCSSYDTRTVDVRNSREAYELGGLRRMHLLRGLRSVGPEEPGRVILTLGEGLRIEEERAHLERRSKRRGDGPRGLDAPGEGQGGADRGVHRRSDGGRSGHRGRRAT